MKKTALLFAATFLSVALFAQSTFTLSGYKTGLEGKVNLIIGSDTLASAPVVDGRFTLVADASVPRIATIENNDDWLYNYVLIEPGEAVIVFSDDRSGQVSIVGTKSNDLMTAYYAKLYTLVAARDSLANTPLSGSVDRLLDNFNNEDYISGNCDNLFGLYKFYSDYRSMDCEKIDNTIKLLSPTFEGNPVLKNGAAYAEAVRNTAIGHQYVNLILKDRDGKLVDLSKMVGKKKYVLLEFWTSYCGGCVAEIPNLKKLYEGFHKKGFEIYGLSIDPDYWYDKWITALDTYSMPWPNVIDDSYEDYNASRDYGIFWIPQNFLIDPEGKIVARNLRGADLQKELEKYFGALPEPKKK